MDKKQKILNQLSVKYGIPIGELEEIIVSPFKFIRAEADKIKLLEADLSTTKMNFKIKGLLTLAANVKQIERVKERNKDLNNNKDEIQDKDC